MMLNDLYQSASAPYNSSSSARSIRAVGEGPPYLDSQVLMTSAVYVLTGRRPQPLLRPSIPPKIVSPEVLGTQTVAERIARLVGSIPSLEAVYVRRRPWGFECWLIANQSTEAERFHLYDLEWAFMEQFPDVGFKFNLIDREGKPRSAVVSIEAFDAIVHLRGSINA